MRGIRRTCTLAGLLVVALLPVVAGGVSPDPQPSPPIARPAAIAQSIAVVNGLVLPPSEAPRLSETGLLVLVGIGLLGLGAVVRKTTPL